VTRASGLTRLATRTLVVIAIAACSDVTAPLAKSAYFLHTVGGQPLPAVIDSTRDPGFSRDVRILGRTLEFLGPDSVQYAEASDIVEPLPDGSLKLWQSECQSLRATYTLTGRQLVVKSVPIVGSAVRYDTLTMFRRDSLVQIQGGLRLAFTPGRPDVPVCG